MEFDHLRFDLAGLSAGPRRRTVIGFLRPPGTPSREVIGIGFAVARRGQW